MDLEAAKKLLKTATKWELRDHAFGDCEVEWMEGKANIAAGYFSGKTREVHFQDGNVDFKGEEADQLRRCFAEEKFERNDMTGPDDFVLGKIMPELTKEAVRQELTEN